jgi:hypothetical protein
VALLIVLAATAMWRTGGFGDASRNLKPIQTIASGDLRIALLDASGTLHQGRTEFIVEFRSASTGRLVDVGNVRVAGSMSMPGMSMSGAIEISRTATPGRYAAAGQFGMAGIWKMTVQWDGPAGQGSAAFEGNVQ